MPMAFVLLNVEPGGEDEVLQALNGIAEVKEAYRVYGVYDTVVKLEAASAERLKELITWKVRRLNKVRSTLTMLAVE
ncbi:MAG: Lrp/AsnC ligand binding domain-containing protein [Nitrososphaerota archaeon]|nr:Lrp/AsnC ligand binding domain-containing protein [Nitrososphaerota archaeon]MDG6938785.1 Lrp/AsnC ligand binding domain-containing protein [Nitrososphaerota archaeon]